MTTPQRESWATSGISPGSSVRFARYCFELPTLRLWMHDSEVRLTPKAAAVLKLLITHAGVPAGKEELFAKV